MLLGDNHGITIYNNIQRNTCTAIGPFSNKVSVELLDRNFSDIFCRQASNRYASK